MKDNQQLVQKPDKKDCRRVSQCPVCFVNKRECHHMDQWTVIADYPHMYGALNQYIYDVFDVRRDDMHLFENIIINFTRNFIYDRNDDTMFDYMDEYYYGALVGCLIECGFKTQLSKRVQYVSISRESDSYESDTDIPSHHTGQPRAEHGSSPAHDASLVIGEMSGQPFPSRENNSREGNKSPHQTADDILAIQSIILLRIESSHQTTEIPPLEQEDSPTESPELINESPQKMIDLNDPGSDTDSSQKEEPSRNEETTQEKPQAHQEKKPVEIIDLDAIEEEEDDIKLSEPSRETEPPLPDQPLEIIDLVEYKDDTDQSTSEYSSEDKSIGSSRTHVNIKPRQPGVSKRSHIPQPSANRTMNNTLVIPSGNVTPPQTVGHSQLISYPHLIVPPFPSAMGPLYTMAYSSPFIGGQFSNLQPTAMQTKPLTDVNPIVEKPSKKRGMKQSSLDQPKEYHDPSNAFKKFKGSFESKVIIEFTRGQDKNQLTIKIDQTHLETFDILKEYLTNIIGSPIQAIFYKRNYERIRVSDGTPLNQLAILLKFIESSHVIIECE